MKTGRAPLCNGPPPETYDAAVERVLAWLSDEEKAWIRGLPKRETHLLHFGLGMMIRTEFGLWNGQNSPLLKECAELAEAEYIHAEVASGMITHDVWLMLRVGRKVRRTRRHRDKVRIAL